MKNKSFVWVLFVLAAFAALTVTGCATTTEGTNNGNFGEHVRTPVKDFETVGLVFTEARLMTTESGGNEGQIFTYQALLKEAQALGADAIINVAIDKKVQVSTFPSSSITTWYGSALAIKYTAILTETGSITATADGVTTTVVTTSVYFNDSGAANAGGVTAKPSAKERPPAPTPSKKGIRQ